MVKMALKGLTSKGLFTRKLPQGYYRIKSSTDLLAPHQDKVSEIYRLAGVQKQVYDKYYLPVISNIAEFTQETPASESHHHAYPGGLLEHILQTSIYALRARKSHILPAKAGPETTTRQADLYTYCVFVGAAMHDIAKPVTDQKVVLYAKPGVSLGEWNGFSTNMIQTPSAKIYTVEFRNDREYRNHELASLMMTRVLPNCGMDWLRSNPKILRELIITIANQDEASVIKDIVKKGDQTSVSLALGAQTAPIYGDTKPLPLKMLTAIRKLKDDGELTFNRQGANSWIADGNCWTMAKTLADMIRKQLEEEGHTGIPTDNTRLFDIMVEHGILTSNADGKAIWKMAISLNDWTPKPFSLVCLPLATVFVNQDTTPDDFDGQVLLVESKAATTEDNKKDSTGTELTKPEKETASTKQKPVTDKSSSLRSIFLDDNDGDTEDETAKESVEKPKSKNSTQPDIRKAKAVVKALPKNADFKTWLESGLKHKTLKINTADAMVHIIPKGLFLVSPKIFKEYAKHADRDWQLAQREFQRLKLHLKNENEENWFEVRVQGKRNYSTIKGWIVPTINVDIGAIDMKKCNPHLSLSR